MKNYISLLTQKDNNQIIIFILLNFLLVIAETVSIALIPLFIDLFVSPGPILANYSKIFKELSEVEDKTTIINYSIIFFSLVFLIKNIFFISVIYYQAYLKKEFNYYLNKKFLNLYLSAPFETIKSYNSSEILRNTVTETKNYVTNFFNILKFSKDIVLFFSIFILLIIVDLYSTIIVLLILSLLAILYISIFYKYLNKIGLRKLKAINSVYKWINQTCGAIKEIKIAKKENKVLENYSNQVNEFENQQKKIEIISSLPNSIFEISFVIIILFMIKFIVDLGATNALPALSLYVVAFIRLLPLVSRFGSTISALRSYSPSAELLNAELIKLKKYTHDEQKFKIENISKLKFEKNFQLKNINFKYNDGKKNIFEDFNYKIEKGKSIAILGKSGSGKTTLINIICGFLEPTEGKLLVDEKDIFNNNIKSWQKNIGLISQDNYLLDDTLTNNILFLDQKDSINQKKFDEAIFFSGVSDFVKELKDGINTKIGEKGSILSSGQIQRVALARLLYRDPEILILDEFTNSLDPTNEDFILDKLKQLQVKKNKTFIIISHKLKPLKICDEIIVLNHGKISETMNYPDFYKKYHLIFN